MCIVCQMPLVSKDDYPDGNTSLAYCKHCGTKDGLFPYKMLIKGMAGFLQSSQGMSEEESAKAAKIMIDESVAVKTGVLKVE